MTPPRLQLDRVSKRYGTFLANDAISLKVQPGEIHAVLGENGAGKSTLMKVIYGSVRADSGAILWDGMPIQSHGTASARRLGIGMVHQHFALFESVTVAENIACALEGPLNLRSLSKRIEALSTKFGMKVDPGRLLYHLSMGERQQVEIIRCLLQEPKLLILDEPTSVLTPQAVQQLFGTLRAIAAEGCSILYISHKLEEVRQLCGTASILRAGKHVGTARPAEISAAELARLMVGADLPEVKRKNAKLLGRTILETERLSLSREDQFGADLKEVSLKVRQGEVVGIAGISGNGQKELFEVISGERLTNVPGSIVIDGESVGRKSALARRARGLACVPEDRLGRGAAPSMSLELNALMTAHDQGLVRHGVVQWRKAAAYAQRIIDRFDVRCRGPRSQAQSLSGGNLQKFIMGRELAKEPKVLVASQPTWGVDVAAAAFIRQKLMDLSQAGAGVLIFSDELDELLEVCDRLYVMHSGHLSSSLNASEVDATTIGLLMTGHQAVANQEDHKVTQDAELQIQT